MDDKKNFYQLISSNKGKIGGIGCGLSLLLFFCSFTQGDLWFAMMLPDCPNPAGACVSGDGKVIGWVVLSIIALLVLFTIVVWSLKRDSKTFGSSRWATAEQLKRAGLIGPGLELGILYGTRAPLQVVLPERLQREHVLLVAPTGKGKTSGVVVPGLLNELGDRGLFINDVKGELIALTAGAVSLRLNVQVFSPMKPAVSVHYNPLKHILSMEQAQDFATSWVNNTGLSKETYWNDTAGLLITAVVLHLREVEPDAPFSRLADILTGTLDQIQTLLTTTSSSLARDIGGAFINTLSVNKVLAAGVLSGMHSRFMILKNPVLRGLTATDDINFQALAEGDVTGKVGALYLSIPASDASRLKPVSAALVSQLMDFLVHREHGRPFAFYLDELCNAGKIEHYAEHISLVRGKGLALIQAIQDFGQLEREYGETDASTILANSTTHIIYPGCSKEETEYYSQRLGFTTVLSSGMSHQVTSYGIPSISSTETRRELMTPDEIRTMPLGRLLVISSNIAPILLHNVPYFQRKEMLGKTELRQQQSYTPATRFQDQNQRLQDDELHRDSVASALTPSIVSAELIEEDAQEHDYRESKVEMPIRKKRRGKRGRGTKTEEREPITESSEMENDLSLES